jgi:hypothetical protein
MSCSCIREHAGRILEYVEREEKGFQEEEKRRKWKR